MAPNGKHFVIVYPARPFTPSSFLFCTPLETNQIASPFCLQTYEDAHKHWEKEGSNNKNKCCMGILSFVRASKQKRNIEIYALVSISRDCFRKIVLKNFFIKKVKMVF